MYKPSCPHCSARKTVKFGLPRWKCLKCKKTFRVHREDQRDRGAVDGYVKDRSTYKRLGERWRVHRVTAYRRVQKALQKRYSLLERTKRHLDECDGILVLDGKWLRIRGKRYTCFVAWDRGYGKPIHFLLREGTEKEVWYWRLLVDLERLGYKPRGFVSDGILSLKEMLDDRYPHLPHQRCAVHVFLSARAKILGGGAPDDRAKAFIEKLRRVLWSKTIDLARQRFQELWNTPRLARGERMALEFISPTFKDIFVACDPRWQRLKLPRSSNSIENVIGNIEARLKTRRGNKSVVAVEILINEILLEVSLQSVNR